LHDCFLSGKAQQIQEDQERVFMSVKVKRKVSGTLVPPFITLASWQLRRMWGLLLIVGLGILAAVVLVCVAPLYSQVALTAGLRDTLNRPSITGGSTTTVSSTASVINIPTLTIMSNTLDQEMKKNLGPYLGESHFSLESNLYSINSAGDSGLTKDDWLRFVSEPMDLAQSHLTLAEGHLPQVHADVVEVALSTESAVLMKAKVGSTFSVKITTANRNTRNTHIINFRVSSLFYSTNVLDPFWHTNTFIHAEKGNEVVGNIYSLLVANQAILPVLEQFVPSGSKDESLELTVKLYWFYSLDTSRIISEDIDTLLNGFNAVSADFSNSSSLILPGQIERVQATVPVDMLVQYRDQIAILLVPVGGLVAIIFLLILYFVSLMTSFLVDRQGPALAILRSRGASGRQVLSALMVQGASVALLTILAGPWLAILAVRLISQQLLQPQDLGGLSLILNNLLHVFSSIWVYVVATVLVALLTMFSAVARTSRMDVLALRRETARTSRPPFWQRLNLDLIAVVIMLAGYGLSFYIVNTINSQSLDNQLSLLFYSPLVLIRTVLTVLAAVLLFLRIFPFLLSLVARIAGRARGASSMVALAQMSRSPAQPVRMTLLLALATAFTIFSIVFYSSQNQRAYDVAAFQSGSDFFGTLPQPVDPTQTAEKTSAYQKISGVRSASLGYLNNQFTAGSGANLSVVVQAVDSATYGRTILWAKDNSTQSLNTLMAQLAAGRASAESQDVLPALVDATLWDNLKLQQGRQFIIREGSVGQAELHLVALARVNYLPGVRGSGGVLVDFQTFANVYDGIRDKTKGTYSPVKANVAWILTQENDAAIKSVRDALTNSDLVLSPLTDRRSLVESFHREPLYLDLIGILTVGTMTALLLALAGNFIASWLSARGRLASFALLRALGAAPGQIAGTLSWEQAIIYTTSMILGVLFGGFLSFNAVPSLLFTSSMPNLASKDFYLMQNIPPIQVVIPVLSGIALALIVGVCIVALGMMVRVVSQPRIAQVLRLNED
jgi:hypothetical protein